MSEPRTVAAAISEVTVLEDRAQIRRRVGLALPPGATRVVIDGVAPALVDKSLLVTAGGGVRVVAASCERYLAPWVEREAGASQGGGQIVALEAERRALVERIADTERAVVLAQGEAAAVITLAKAALAELADAAAWGEPDPGAAARLAVLDAREQAARLRAAELATELEERRLELNRLDTRLAEVRGRIGREAARLSIELVADAAADAELGIEYVVPGAAWRPYHRARLDPRTGALTWRTDACVWQATGEDWAGAQLVFSTERPSLGVEPPELATDELRWRRRPETVVVEAREQEQQTTGLGALEVPGIDDGGVGTRLRATSPATIPADGRPYRVLLGEREMTATSALVAMPERHLGAHVRAVATNPGPTPILAGPVDLLLATGYAGRGVINFIASGEKLELGFGPDAELRLHREEDRKRDEGGLLSGWNQTRVRVAVRLSNLGDTAKRVEVTERIPISEVTQVVIEVSPPEAWKLERDDGVPDESAPLVTGREIDDKGMVTWMVDLPPRDRRAIALEYRIRSQKGVTGV